jgi:two-component system chemotaxis sensor kinase CheA
MADSFVNDFIEDYYAECDEHLNTVKRVLLGIEERPDVPPSTEARAELARALHTVKGLSGMVGFSDAESIAHLVEDWIRSTVVIGQSVSRPGLEGLFDGARLLEASISAHREGVAPPDTGAFAERVRATVTTAARSDSASTGTAESPGDGDVYEYDFAPDKELAAAGITVEKIRAALSASGRIIQAVPRVVDGGGVAFRFVVSFAEGANVPPADPSQGLTRTQRATVEHNTDTVATATDAVLASGAIVRVDLARLDELMRLVGELVMSRGRIEERLEALDRRDPHVVALIDDVGLMERQIRDLRAGIMHVRMVPIAEVFERMRYVAREAARESGKNVRVEISGQDTEVDKYVVERMMEPLLHLVRNAIGHGIETPTEREANGKQPTGSLILRAWTSGERIVISLRDDGAGVDFSAVEQRARSLGLWTGAEPIDAQAALRIISEPAFSTRDTATLTSGRGVGMAVVSQRMRELGGELTMNTARGAGTTFLIRLPLTLMIVDAIMFRMNGALMAVPQPGLIEVLQVEREDITAFENNEVVQYRERILPLFRLRRVFGMTSPREERSTEHVLVIGSEEDPVGIVVDRIVGQREIVVRSMKDPLVTVPGISGATELSDGTVALILDTTQIAERALLKR